MLQSHQQEEDYAGNLTKCNRCNFNASWTGPQRTQQGQVPKQGTIRMRARCKSLCGGFDNPQQIRIVVTGFLKFKREAGKGSWIIACIKDDEKSLMTTLHPHCPRFPELFHMNLWLPHVPRVKTRFMGASRCKLGKVIEMRQYSRRYMRIIIHPDLECGAWCLPLKSGTLSYGKAKFGGRFLEQKKKDQPRQYVYEYNLHSGLKTKIRKHRAKLPRISKAPAEWLRGIRKKHFEIELCILEPKFCKKTTEKIFQIKERLKTARSRQKSYADKRRKPLEFEVGDRVLLNVSPWKGVNLLRSVERDEMKLKRRRIPLVKVRWNSRQGAEYTWEREDQFRIKLSRIFLRTLTVVKDVAN
ncbi:hypothetical protein Tco_0697074 [Tanacetum coccineum]